MEEPPIPTVPVRRRSREIRDEAWIQRVLTHAPAGVLAARQGEQPFLFPNLFVYDHEARMLYVHTTGAGQTRVLIENEAHVAFCVSELGRLLPAECARDFSAEYGQRRRIWSGYRRP